MVEKTVEVVANQFFSIIHSYELYFIPEAVCHAPAGIAKN